MREKEASDLSRNVFIKEENRRSSCRLDLVTGRAITLRALSPILENVGNWRNEVEGGFGGSSIKFIFVPAVQKKKEEKEEEKKKGLSSPSIQFPSKRGASRSQSRPTEFQVSVSKRKAKWPIFSAESDTRGGGAHLINNPRESRWTCSSVYSPSNVLIRARARVIIAEWMGYKRKWNVCRLLRLVFRRGNARIPFWNSGIF